MLTEERIQYQDDFFLRKWSNFEILEYHAPRKIDLPTRENETDPPKIEKARVSSDWIMFLG